MKSDKSLLEYKLQKGFVIFGKTCSMPRFYIIVFLTLIVFSCSKVNHLAKVDSNVYQLDGSVNVGNVNHIDSIIQPYKKEVDKEMNKVIGQTSKSLTMAFPEGTLGNFVADVLHEKAVEHYEGRVDFAFINYWSIRIEEIPKGAITKSHVFELMPFENHLVIMKVEKNIVLQLFENMAQKGGWPVSKQVQFKIKNGKPFDVLINEQPLQENYIYHIAVSNYLANGGDNCSFFINQNRDNLEVMIRDMIMNGIVDIDKAGKLIDAEIEGRIIEQ